MRCAPLLFAGTLAACAGTGAGHDSVARSADSLALRRDIHWVRTSAEYFAACIQTYRMAIDRITVLASMRSGRSWGVVLDADETVLDNSTYQNELAARGESYSQQSWTAWVKRRAAGAVPGAVAFTNRVHELGGVVAIVTNRSATECPDTEANLRALGAVYDVVLCRPDAGSWDKVPRFDALANGKAGLPPVEIVAYLGDNIQDFPALTQQLHRSEGAFRDFGVRFFVIPNPMYGSWERLIQH
jgi:5'-nucleotidase (lipoprotein e(P4) family)